MGKKWTKSPPDWFNLPDYQVDPPLDRRGWAIMIWARSHYRAACKKERSEGGLVTTESKEAFWNCYLQDVLPRQFVNGGSILPLSSGLGPPRAARIEDVTADLAGLETAEIGETLSVMMMFDFGENIMGRRILLIDPLAPAANLKDDFSRLIEKIRQEQQAPPLNDNVTENRLGSWEKNRVLAVCDLDFFAELFGEGRRITHETLYDILQPDLDDAPEPKDWGRDARHRAKVALDAVDLLLLSGLDGAA